MVITEKMDGENTTLYTTGHHARSLDGVDTIQAGIGWLGGTRQLGTKFQLTSEFVVRTCTIGIVFRMVTYLATSWGLVFGVQMISQTGR